MKSVLPGYFPVFRKQRTALQFTKMNASEQCLDLTLVVRDGKEFKVHKEVLSTASPFFEKLLNSDMRETREGVIRLEIFTESEMTDILEFIYTGNVKISTRENAQNLMAIADYLYLSNLKALVGKFLEQNLSTLNCFSTLCLAEEYFCDELIRDSRKFIVRNFLAVAETKHFMNLPNHEVEKWISSDDIIINGEEDVFKIVVKWVWHNKSERRQRISELFRHVRLSLLSRDFLVSDVVTNDLVSKDCLDHVSRH